MRILYIYQYFCTPKGSWSTRVYEMTRRWRAAGHQITVITSPYEKTDIKADGLISVQNIDGIKVIVINSGDSNRKSVFMRAYYAILFSVLSSIIGLMEKVDLVIASSGPMTVAIPALLLKWIKRVPMIFEVRDLWPDGAIELEKISNPVIIITALKFELLSYSNSDMVVACSTDMQARIQAKCKPKQSIVIPNASDIDTYKYSKAVKSHKPYFIYTGSLGFMDDMEYVLNGLRLFSVDELQLFDIIVLGEGSERASLETLCHQYGLPNVIFKGLLPKYEVYEWLQGAVASLILFKNYEILGTNSPNKMFDAFSVGVPIIQNTRGWIKELVEQKTCGINVYPDNPEELKQAIEKILSDESFCEKARENSLSLAQNEFNREHLSKKYLNALEDLYERSNA